MLGLACIFLLGLLVAGLITVRETVRVLRNPPRRTYSWAVARGRPGDPGELGTPRAFRAWTFTHDGRTLPAWDMAGDVAGGPVVVVTHGWGDSRVTMLARVDALARHASRVVLWDLPGHGEAAGRCDLGATEAGTLEALLAGLPEADRVVLYGFSLGAGISIEAAYKEQRSLIGVIAEAPYRYPETPAAAVLRAISMPYRWNLPLANWWIGLGKGGRLAASVFDRALHASRLKVPLLVVHGEMDEVSPIADGEAIASAAARGRLVRVANADHLGVWANPESASVAEAACRAFMERCVAADRREPVQS